MAALHDLYDRYGDRVEFVVVYIREAHPEDAWALNQNRDEAVMVYDPVSRFEREAVAQTCVVRTSLRIPTVVDDVDDALAKAYGGWPDRLYLISADGRVAFQGDPGPLGFQPDALEAAIERELRSSPSG